MELVHGHFKSTIGLAIQGLILIVPGLVTAGVLQQNLVRLRLIAENRVAMTGGQAGRAGELAVVSAGQYNSVRLGGLGQLAPCGALTGPLQLVLIRVVAGHLLNGPRAEDHSHVSRGFIQNRHPHTRFKGTRVLNYLPSRLAQNLLQLPALLLQQQISASQFQQDGLRLWDPTLQRLLPNLEEQPEIGLGEAVRAQRAEAEVRRLRQILGGQGNA